MVLAGILIAGLAVGVGVQMLRARPEGQEDRKRGSVSNIGEMSSPAVRVNGEVITRQQLALECMEQFGRQVLESLINRKIIQQSCAERGVHVTDAEVEAEVTRLSKHAGLPRDLWYKFIQLNPTVKCWEERFLQFAGIRGHTKRFARPPFA